MPKVKTKDSQQIVITKKGGVSDVTAPNQRKKSEKERSKNSFFMLTINTNQRYGPHEEGLEEYAWKLYEACQSLVNDENLPDLLRITEEKLEVNPEHEISPKYVDKVEIESWIERGEKNDQVHAHIGIHVKHRTLLRLDKQFIYDHICQEMDLKSCYVSRPKVGRGSAELEFKRFKDYSKKNVIVGSNE